MELEHHFSHSQNSTLKRKGAWTPEEDHLLRKCIEMYGEGAWHLVPARAGLNRCRKSCRLRWLNYLCPKIKRGEFSIDEIDLIIRLHKLLGNRWSLIAGRLPGRTANDIKNHWNAHLRKRVSDYHNYKGKMKHKFVKVIRPKPRHVKSSIRFDVAQTLVTEAPLKDQFVASTSECFPKEHMLLPPEVIAEEGDNTCGTHYEGDKLLPFSISESMGFEDECTWDSFLKDLELMNAHDF